MTGSNPSHPSTGHAGLPRSEQVLDHLQQLERTDRPTFRGTPDQPETTPIDPEDETHREFYDEETGGFWESEVVSGSKSWLASMIIHLTVILGLALLTMRVSVNPPIALELGTDDLAAMTELDDFQLDMSSMESFDQANTQPEERVAEQLLEYQPELEFAADFEEPLFETGEAIGQQNLSQVVARHLQEVDVSGGGGSSFFGISANAGNIVYIVDRSGSMQGKRWADASSELIKSIESLQPDQKFFVYLFSDACHPMPQLEGRNNLVSASKSNIDAVKLWLGRQFPNDSTMPLSSVRRALRMEPDMIFLLTDGQFYDRTGPYLLRRAVLQQNVSDPDDVVINTIAFHCDVGLEMLQEIARSYHGTFRSVE
ncbi:MAG: hypothetical protein ACR2NP_17320 [Pirellulaceae bacterium]